MGQQITRVQGLELRYDGRIPPAELEEAKRLDAIDTKTRAEAKAVRAALPPPPPPAPAVVTAPPPPPPLAGETCHKALQRLLAGEVLEHADGRRTIHLTAEGIRFDNKTGVSGPSGGVFPLTGYAPKRS